MDSDEYMNCELAERDFISCENPNVCVMEAKLEYG